MSGITGLSGYNSSLWQWLSQHEVGSSEADSDLASVSTDGTQAVSAAAETDDQSTGSTDLESQIRSAVLSALQSAEQSGGMTNLKGVIHSALAHVLKANGIDPRTLKTTGSSEEGSATDSANDSQSQSDWARDSSTNTLLIQMMTALNSATQSFMSQRMPSLFDNQESDDMSSLLTTPLDSAHGASDSSSLLLGSQQSNTDLVGFLLDSSQ